MEERISYKKTTLIVMIITLLSKITGFFREIVLGSTYGATYVTDAYLVSQTIHALCEHDGGYNYYIYSHLFKNKG